MGGRRGFARRVRPPGVAALPRGRPGLLEEALRGLERFSLRRLQRTPFELRDEPLHITDLLPGTFREPLLLLGRQLGSKRGLRGDRRPRRGGDRGGGGGPLGFARTRTGPPGPPAGEAPW